jgi:hypothetical protein
MQAALAAAFAAGPDGAGGEAPDGPQRSPEQAAMARLYQDMASLPPQLQMFMRGCPPELEAKRHRINCREVVMRNLLALSAGSGGRSAGTWPRTSPATRTRCR